MDNTSMTPGYGALQHGAGLIDLSSRGRIRVSGDDRARLLHAMTTNHVQQLRPGEGLYTFFLSAQGRIMADAYTLCFEDHFLLDTEPQTRELVREHLDRYTIADDVTLDDISEQTFCFGLEGPMAFELIEGIGLPTPRQSCAHIGWGGLDLAAVSFTGAPGVRIYGPAARREELLQSLEGSGAIAVSEREAESARLTNFKPRFGVDFSDTSLPQETQQMHALHFQKGCYLGQEIVERLRSRGHVNKQLMGFRIAGDHAPRKGSPVLSGGKEAGEVTSAAHAPDGHVYGLAVVRVPHNRPGAEVEINGRAALLFAPQLQEVS